MSPEFKQLKTNTTRNNSASKQFAHAPNRSARNNPPKPPPGGPPRLYTRLSWFPWQSHRMSPVLRDGYGRDGPLIAPYARSSSGRREWRMWRGHGKKKPVRWNKYQYDIQALNLCLRSVRDTERVTGVARAKLAPNVHAPDAARGAPVIGSSNRNLILNLLFFFRFCNNSSQYFNWHFSFVFATLLLKKLFMLGQCNNRFLLSSWQNFRFSNNSLQCINWSLSSVFASLLVFDLKRNRSSCDCIITVFLKCAPKIWIVQWLFTMYQLETVFCFCSTIFFFFQRNRLSCDCAVTDFLKCSPKIGILQNFFSAYQLACVFCFCHSACFPSCDCVITDILKFPPKFQILQ